MTTLESLNGDLFQKMELYTIDNTQHLLGGVCKTWANEKITTGDEGACSLDKSYDSGSNIVCLG